jgi:hypothetical protein
MVRNDLAASGAGRGQGSSGMTAAATAKMLKRLTMVNEATL